MVKKVKKIAEVEIVKEKTRSLVGLKEKLLCLSMYDLVFSLVSHFGLVYDSCKA